MTSAYVLITAILILGGLIAVLGDRVGSKIGKARLRLFNLRPRQTAVVVTVITGFLIAASTLGILFALSKPLREGIFRIDEILKQQRIVKADLEVVTREKNQVQQELSAAKTEQLTVQTRLKEINQNFKRAKEQLTAVSQQAGRLRADIKILLNERQQLFQQKILLNGQIARLQAQVQIRDEELHKQERKIADQNQILKQRQIRFQQLQKQFQELDNKQHQLQTKINQRDDRIKQLDQAIAQKDSSLKTRETQLNELESQLTFLKREVEVLEQYYQNYQELRERKIAIFRGQVLAFGAVRILEPQAAIQVIDELLRQANRMVIQATRTENNNNNTEERVVKITKAQVEQLISQLQNGKDYVVRILSAGNYVQGEQEVRVFADVTPNQLIFKENDTIANVSLDSSNLTEEEIQKRLDLLLSATQFRARSSGILGSIQVEDGRIKTLLNFVETLGKSEEKFDEIRAIASNDTYTVGPLKIHLVAIKNGKVIFSTSTFQ